MDGFAHTLGIEVTDADYGRAALAFEAGQTHLNPAGTVHGGVLATLVDTAMGAAVRSTIGDGEVPATSQLTIAYLRPGTVGRMDVSATVRQRGRHLLVCEAEVAQAGKPVAHAMATFALLG